VPAEGRRLNSFFIQNHSLSCVVSVLSVETA